MEREEMNTLSDGNETFIYICIYIHTQLKDSFTKILSQLCPLNGELLNNS